MNIKLTSVPLTAAVVRYPHRGGACLGGSILGDKPSRMLRAFEAHHGRFGVADEAPLLHLTVSAPRGVRLTPRAWRATLALTLRELGAPIHTLVWVAYRHLRTMTDHAHLLFSRYTIHGTPITPITPPDLYDVGNRLCRRVGLPTPFPDIKTGPVTIQAPVRARDKRQTERASDASIIGLRVNEALSVDRPDTYSSFVQAAMRHGVRLRVRHYRNGTEGLAYALEHPKPKNLMDVRPTVWVPGGRIGLQFTLKGLRRRLALLRYLNELPYQLAVMKLFENAPPSAGVQLDLWREQIDQQREAYRLNWQRGGSDRGDLAAGAPAGSDCSPAGPAGRGAGPGPGRGERASEKVIRVPLGLAAGHDRHGDEGQQDRGHGRVDKGGSGGAESAAGADGEDAARDSWATNHPHPLTLAEIIGTLARLTVQWRITLSLRFEDDGGFVISGGQMPFLRYRPNQGVELLAHDYPGLMHQLVDDLRLRLDPTPAGPLAPATAGMVETMPADGSRREHEDRPVEELDQADGPDL